MFLKFLKMLFKISVLLGPFETEEEGSVLSGHLWVVKMLLEMKVYVRAF